jgi:hypothetical protein
MALTKKLQQCKEKSLSPQIQYCRNHLHLAPMVTLDNNNNENKQAEPTTANNFSMHQISCLALNKKGNQCNGHRLEWLGILL